MGMAGNYDRMQVVGGLLQTTFLIEVGGALVIPRGHEVKGGSLVNYIICSKALAPTIQAFFDIEGTWATHLGT